MLRLRRRNEGKSSPRHSPAAEDARALALQLAGLRPPVLLDPMSLELVLEPGESAYRIAELWLSHRGPSGWSAPASCCVVVTDRRLIVRMPLGELTSLWWGSLVGFHPNLSKCSLILDYGDGFPRSLSGPEIPAVTVVGVVALYGVAALADHAALAPLRDSDS
jgi:hypothetical protein